MKQKMGRGERGSIASEEDAETAGIFPILIIIWLCGGSGSGFGRI